MLQQLGLVSQTRRVSLGQLNLVVAALQKQVARDLGPLWKINASVAAFEKLTQIPLGYWPVIVRDDIPYDAQGIHLNKDNGQPYALIQYSTNWSLTTSHEALEMLVDPSGNRLAAGNSIKPGQGRVQYLVEVCDPCEAARFGYSVNGVLVSDFYTPHYFDPVRVAGVRYSYTGAITAPRQVLDQGYLSWFEPTTKHVWQAFVVGKQRTFRDLGSYDASYGSLRAFTDRPHGRLRSEAAAGLPPQDVKLSAAIRSPRRKSQASRPPDIEIDRSVAAAGRSLEKQIAALLAHRGAG